MKLKTEISNGFNRHAFEYEQAARVQKEIGLRLFERLDYLKIKPAYVLDLGCGTGMFSKQLKKRYPKALIVSLDIAELMLKQTQKTQSIFNKWPLIQADMMQMPFASGIFDVVFANQSIHWAEALPPLMSEINRVMNVDGCLMMSTLGPDTFSELRLAFARADGYAHTNTFIDMHDLGDMLMAGHFADPVVDMQKLTVHYDTLQKLLRTLKSQGVRNINASRNPGLTSRAVFQTFEKAMNEQRTVTGRFPLTYEVVYGHAWKGAARQTKQGDATFVPLSALNLGSYKT